MLKTEALRQKSTQLGKDKQKIVEDFDFWSTVSLPSPPVHLAVSKDGLSLLACVLKSNQLYHGLVYDVRGFTNKVSIVTDNSHNDTMYI